MKVWIARDKDGQLFLYTDIPYTYGNKFGLLEDSNGLYMELDRKDFPEIKRGKRKEFELKEVK